jgi:hypothetical protein
VCVCACAGAVGVCALLARVRVCVHVLARVPVCVFVRALVL